MAATLKPSLLAAFSVRTAQRSCKAWIWALVTTVSLLVLTSCGPSSAASTTASSDPMTPALKLALGTLHLEGTEQAVDATTAARLLPLWELLDELSTNSAAAPAETTAVIEQIESTMTAAQLKAIQALNLTDNDVTKASEGGGAATATGTTTAGSSGRASSAAGRKLLAGSSGAGMPLDGGGPMPGAASGQNGSASGSAPGSSNTSLIKEVIQLLERKLQD